ncbi:MAG: hypothetical protein RLZZ480_337 [Candidatus Parcubacteria bacterium]|jgi:glycosyltransferase involved in cell wall biosynthesis
MKLLITTQVVDKNHPILGFFHRWLEEFAKYCEEVHVVCLYKGEYDLPQNVHVYSLGKEEGVGKFEYIRRFYTYIWQLRKRYDSVFCHMNEEYVLMGGLFWRLYGKRIGHWYMHGVVKWSLYVSEKLAHVVFSGSKESYRIKSKKLRITGHGIDTTRFAPQSKEKTYDLLTVGRITPSKNLDMLIEVLKQVREKQNVSLSIIGSLEMPGDQVYIESLRKKIAEYGLTDYVHFLGAIPNYELPGHIARARVFVQAAQNGSLDKALLEPLAMEVSLVTCAEGAQSLPLGDWQVKDVNSFSDRVVGILQSDTTARSHELALFVKKNHSLESLIPYIVRTLEKTKSV